MNHQNSTSGLLERLQNGGSVVVAEGYVFEFERRGYLKAGAYVPEVVLDHPELVKQMHEEFVHAGSDVVLAFTYYGHREKLRLIGKEDQLAAMNKKALALAREVARATGTLFAGNICNSTIYNRDDKESQTKVAAMFKEQVEWSVEEGVDLIIAETFQEVGEALLALEVIRTYGKGVPAVVTLCPAAKSMTYDGVPFGEACRRLEEAGAAVVGLNCNRGPDTMIPLMREIRKACKGPIACLPAVYRTSDESLTMQSLRDPCTGKCAFPTDLPSHACSRSDIERYARACREIGVNYIGLCCGSCSHYLRIVAEIYGRTPGASKYSPDMSEHYMFGDKSKFSEYSTKGLIEYANGF
ncbi:betaine--homocysteine S-methyltransferase 1 [Aplysia californica]|uniref:Betaine--homocysteine S-methyltransferase 1 n=1 Tax=Aplysia californica TaxID=6500 RepID=A0ABM0JAP6_APLCA|nr:betaine--homocysteine S-methyltransferase 1 [Aplysia californica]